MSPQVTSPWVTSPPAPPPPATPPQAKRPAVPPRAPPPPQRPPPQPEPADSAGASASRFVPAELRFACPQTSAWGVSALLGLSEESLNALDIPNRGVQAIEDEIRRAEARSLCFPGFNAQKLDAMGWRDVDWLDYCLGPATERDDLPDGMPSRWLDRGHDGRALESFRSQAQTRGISLSLAQVLALRLYTTSVYENINEPLRKGCPLWQPHPYPALVVNLVEACKKFRGDNCCREVWELFRGSRDFDVGEEFRRRGGAELAMMSTTSDRSRAESYATKRDAKFVLLLQFVAPGSGPLHFMHRGADVSFLSVFPEEEEFVYPPGTCLMPPTDIRYEVRNGVQYKIVVMPPPVFPS